MKHTVYFNKHGHVKTAVSDSAIVPNNSKIISCNFDAGSQEEIKQRNKRNSKKEIAINKMKFVLID